MKNVKIVSHDEKKCNTKKKWVNRSIQNINEMLSEAITCFSVDKTKFKLQSLVKGFGQASLCE